MVTLHEQKAALFYKSFRERIGVSNSPTMGFDLNELFPDHVCLDNPVDPFFTQEMDTLIRIILQIKPQAQMALMVFSSKDVGTLLPKTFIGWLHIST